MSGRHDRVTARRSGVAAAAWVAGWLLALPPACAPQVHRAVDGSAPAALRPLDADALRRHFTRAAIPPDLDFRWLEATLVDPTWIRADVERLARLGEWSAEMKERRLRERLEDLEPAQGVAFELWLLTQCHHCEELDRWYWMLQGPGRSGPASTPSDVRWEVVDQDPQTLSWLGVQRRIHLKKVRAVLRFERALEPGHWVLHGLPSGTHPSFSFEWRLAPRPDAPDPGEPPDEAGS